MCRIEEVIKVENTICALRDLIDIRDGYKESEMVITHVMPITNDVDEFILNLFTGQNIS